MDKYDQKQLKIFREFLCKEKAFAAGVVAKWENPPEDEAFLKKHMQDHYQAHIEQCDSILHEFDEIFGDYVYTGENAVELLAICKRVNLDCNDKCPIHKAYKGKIPMDDDECRCSYFEDGFAMLDYLKGGRQ